MSISRKLKEIIDEIICEDCGCVDEEIDEIVNFYKKNFIW